MEGAPASVRTAAPAGPRRRRGPREWAVDIGLFLAAVGYGLAWAVALSEDPEVTETALLREQVVCAAACAAVWLRRRWPVGLSLGLIPLSAYAALADGAQLVALFTVAVHRSARTSALCGVATVAGQMVYFALFSLLASPQRRPDDGELQWITAFTAVMVAAVLGWGAMVRHRRQLVLSLQERAARAESEARLRAEQAQLRAREQIAREMHDVLGHRLSLLSVHAGALEYRPDAPAAEVARAAAVIRDSAHRALQDLREVIGVLRAPVGELPQPTLADVRGLVAESAAAGMRVELHEEVAGRAPDTTGRTAYRIVQEGLTNARRHAPGARVRVGMRGAPGDGLSVEVGNDAPPAGSNAAETPGTGEPPRPSAGDRGGTGGPAGAAPLERPESGRRGRSGAGDSSQPPGPSFDPMREGEAAPPESAEETAGPPIGGQGLVGLAERVSLAGGRLGYGPGGSGGFHLHAWLPWEEEAE
ncbi:sensor histidine kinase [Streptomonospora sp. PA3]|uniref:sensor histidine kinase n=1 Tax=Streptomonospora sp. PA3 TaxID=2607326 RepID=UPI0012DC9388|nr:histidine kinase [Streptomonospora sp. PA3]MUL41681.1 sensor histidine kinase [Streptomonospora sp. PA3]